MVVIPTVFVYGYDFAGKHRNDNAYVNSSFVHYPKQHAQVILLVIVDLDDKAVCGAVQNILLSHPALFELVPRIPRKRKLSVSF